ncbi:hypothetical protein OG809_37465 [Kribbella soli]
MNSTEDGAENEANVGAASVLTASPGVAPLGRTPQPAVTRKPSFVYALGRVEPRFASLAIEKEFAQTMGRAETAGLTDRQALLSLLETPSNRHLIRQLCWVFTVEGIETYILVPGHPSDFDLLVDTVRPERSGDDVDVVVGVRGALAAPEKCNGLVVPVVAFTQIYSFDRDGLVAAIPRPDELDAERDEDFRSSAAEMFDRIMQIADNAGATDEHRAVNYLALRYPAIYAKATEAHASELSLSGIEARPSRLSGTTRDVVDVIFTFTSRRTDVADKYFVRVDVTEEFPFLVTKLSSYYDR